MKYETLSEYKTGSYNLNDTITFTFTYSNNIDHIESFTFKQADTNLFGITSCTVSGNVLTTVFTCYRTSSAGPYTVSTHLTVTVAGY